MTDIKLGILVVHGVGSQSRGGALRQVANPLREFIESAGAERHTTLSSKGHPLDDKNGPDRTVWTITDAQSGETSTILLAETQWSESFKAAKYTEMIWWMITHGLWTFRVMVRSASGAVAGAVPVSRRTFLARCARGALKVVAFVILLLAAIATGALVVVLPLLLVLFVLARWFKPAKWLAEKVTLGIAASLGDAFTFIRKNSEREAIVARVQQDLAWVRTQTGVIHVVAHSLGAPVVIDALCDEEAREGVKRLTFLGNALAATGVANRSKPKFPAVLPVGRLHDIPCVNLATSQDPVSIGKLVIDSADADFDSPRVDNQHSVLRDHTTYFSNTEQVIGRIAVNACSVAGLTRFAAEIEARRVTADDLRVFRKDCETVSTATVLLAIFAGLCAMTSSFVDTLSEKVRRLEWYLRWALPETGEKWFKSSTGWIADHRISTLALAAAVCILMSSVVILACQRRDDRFAAKRLAAATPRLYRWPGTTAASWSVIVSIGAVAAHVARWSMHESTALTWTAFAVAAVLAVFVSPYLVLSNHLTMSAHDLEPRGLLFRRR